MESAKELLGEENAPFAAQPAVRGLSGLGAAPAAPVAVPAPGKVPLAFQGLGNMENGSVE